MASEDFMTKAAPSATEPINQSALREEINLYYVAATRAK